MKEKEVITNLHEKLRESLKHIRLKTALLIAVLSAIVAGCKGQEVKLPPVVPSPQQKETIELVNKIKQETPEKREEVGAGIGEIETYLKKAEAILSKKDLTTEDIETAEAMLLEARKRWALMIKQNPGLAILINYLHQTINLKQDILEYKQIMEAMDQQMKSLDELKATLK